MKCEDMECVKWEPGSACNGRQGVYEMRGQGVREMRGREYVKWEAGSA
jgi:hypothetical protein